MTPFTGDFAGTTAAFTYAYADDSFGLIESVTGPAHTVTNAWQADRDVLDWKENKAGSTVISKYDYGVNAIGQRTSVASTGTAFGTAPDWNWHYNARGELALSQHAVTTAAQDYSYDGIGNRTAAQGVAYVSNALNQYEDIDGYPLWHDDDGNLQSNALISRDYYWDGENRLQMVYNGSYHWSRCLYDAFGRRVSQGEGEYDDSMEESLPDSYDFSSCGYSVYDGWNLVAEYSGTPHSSGTPPVVTLAKSWVWGIDLSGTLQGAGGVGGLLAVKAGSTIGHPLYDGNGNACRYLNGSGAVIASYEYDGFGRTLAQSGTHQWAFPHRFSTKYQDDLSWLYYYGYRDYDTLTGRWLSRDPVEEKGGANLYAYLGNNAPNDIDYLGFYSFGAGYGALYSQGAPPPQPPQGIPVNRELECQGEGERETEVLTADEVSNDIPIWNNLGHLIDKWIHGEEEALGSAITATWDDPCGEDELLGMALVHAVDAGSTNSRVEGENGVNTIQSRNIALANESLKKLNKAKFCCKCK